MTNDKLTMQKKNWLIHYIQQKTAARHQSAQQRFILFNLVITNLRAKSGLLPGLQDSWL